MNALVPMDIGQVRAPAGMAARRQQANVNSNFADGIADRSYPLLSIKGKVFRMRLPEGATLAGHTGEVIIRDQHGAVRFLDVVMVQGNRLIAKTFYEKGFVDDAANFGPPDCWSLDSVRPDPSVQKKQSPTCANCPKNEFGSRITESGKAAKACSDSRRVVIMLPQQLQGDDEDEFTIIGPSLLRVPQTSLKNMKRYVMDVLGPHDFEPRACITRLSFDDQDAFPRLKFQFVAPLNDEEYLESVRWSEDPRVAAMLAAPDFDATASKPAEAQKPEEPMRQAKLSMGFGPGDAQPQQAKAQPKPEPVQQKPEPVQQAKAEQPAPNYAAMELLPTGEYLDLETGEVWPAPEVEEDKPEVDPDVTAMKDGRFYNRRTKAFVEGPFKEAATPAQGEVIPPKKKVPPKQKKIEAQPDQAGPAPQTETASADPAPGGNGAVTEEQQAKQVVAASPKLESLISGMKARKQQT